MYQCKISGEPEHQPERTISTTSSSFNQYVSELGDNGSFYKDMLYLSGTKDKIVNEFDKLKFTLDNLLNDPSFDVQYVEDVKNYIREMGKTVNGISDEE